MTSYALLDQFDEDSLHHARLLNVEEKPFKRISRRLLAPASLLTAPITYLPTPPPDDETANDDATAKGMHESLHQKRLDDFHQARADVTLDFAAFDASVARMQLTQASNAAERVRYADERARIQERAATVRDNMAVLRVRLAEARATQEQRMVYDRLADRIVLNRLLRPREDTRAALDRLTADIAALERERADYKRTWAERREQFGRIVDEGMQLRRLIRDEKEEVERREGMEDGCGEGEGEGEGENEHVGEPEGGGIREGHNAPNPQPAVSDQGEDEGEVTGDEEKMDTT